MVRNHPAACWRGGRCQSIHEVGHYYQNITGVNRLNGVFFLLAFYYLKEFNPTPTAAAAPPPPSLKSPSYGVSLCYGANSCYGVSSISCMVLTRVMVLTHVMVLTPVMVLTHVIVFTRVTV